MLSGVGPSATLTQYGIPIVSDIEEVGQNLDDQFVVIAPVTTPVPWNPIYSNFYGIYLFIYLFIY